MQIPKNPNVLIICRESFSPKFQSETSQTKHDLIEASAFDGSASNRNFQKNVKGVGSSRNDIVFVNRCDVWS